MLVRPAISDDQLRACLWQAYGRHACRIRFLPLGNDVNTAAFLVVDDDRERFFLRLRGGPFVAASVAVPTLLHDQGVAQVIPALRTVQGALWTRLGPFAVTLFPFVEGQNGFAAPLTDLQWTQLGAALRALHQLALPAPLLAELPRERYAGEWRRRVRALLAQSATASFEDGIAAEVAAFLRAHRAEIGRIVARAEELGRVLRAQSPPVVPCHGDIHAANVLLSSSGALSLVDWDTLTLAPKERDLMFIGGGIGGRWTGEDDIARFYQGYGATAINQVALAYYRYERIVEDIAEYGERLLGTNLSDADRRAGLAKFLVLFQPGHVVDIAQRTDSAEFRGPPLAPTTG